MDPAGSPAHLSPLQLSLFLEWTMYPRTSSHRWRWEDIRTTAGLGFLKKIVFKLWLSSVSVMFPVVPWKDGERERERIEDKREAESKTDRGSARSDESFNSPRNWFWFVSPAPLQVIEGIMVLLRSELLWDTVPGQGQWWEGPCKEWVLIPQLWPLWSRRGCTTWQVWILEHVAWCEKGCRGSVKMEKYYNPGRWNQVQRRQKEPGLHKSDADTWQERSCHVPGNCRWAFYILPPALRSPFLSNSSLHFDVLGFCLHLSLPLQIL